MKSKIITNSKTFVMGKRDQENGHNASSLQSGATLARYDSLRVLLVDDNQMNRMIASSLLQQRHRVIPDIATTGREALNVLSNGDYDLIFMDCMMPEMDGYEATRAIRAGEAGERHRRIPIVALTANTRAGDREDCIAAGMDDYLTKPLHVNDLEMILKKWCGDGEGVQLDSHQGEKLDSDAVLDIPTLRRVLDDDEALIADMIDCYRKILLSSLNSIEKAIDDEKEIEQVRFHTHTIRGSSDQYGASKLSAAAAKMEAACFQGAFGRAADLYDEVKVCSREVLAELEKCEERATLARLN